MIKGPKSYRSLSLEPPNFIELETVNSTPQARLNASAPSLSAVLTNWSSGRRHRARTFFQLQGFRIQGSVMHETSPRRASGRHFRETSFKKGELRTDPARFKIGGNSYIKLGLPHSASRILLHVPVACFSRLLIFDKLHGQPIGV